MNNRGKGEKPCASWGPAMLTGLITCGPRGADIDPRVSPVSAGGRGARPGGSQVAPPQGAPLVPGGNPPSVTGKGRSSVFLVCVLGRSVVSGSL